MVKFYVKKISALSIANMEKSDKCQFNSSTCGTHSQHREKVDYIILKELRDDVGGLFNANVPITECELICLRSERSLDLDALICDKHRFTLGKGYRPSILCRYPEHLNSKAKGINVPWELYNFVKKKYPKFVLGSLICKTCQAMLNKLKFSEPMECDEDDNIMDVDFVPSVPFFDDNEKMERRVKLDGLTDALETERIRYQISSDIHHLSPISLSYFRRVHHQMQNNLTEQFCRFVAPGQEKELKIVLERDEKVESDTVIEHLKKSFDTCATARARRAVLMLVPKTLSKDKVSELFDCSLYEVRRARSILKQYGACGEEPKTERPYSRLSFEKARHFIDFLFSTGLLQEVAYGTTKLKFESGDKITVANTILNGINEHAVKEYKIYCKEINYDALGRSTLLNILKKMKPHTRKKLSGIDSFVVQGVEAFETLRQSVKLLQNNDQIDELTKSINKSERYLKARYKMHCSNDDSCITHCIDFALSHPKDTQLLSKCEKKHDRNCGECLAMVNCIASIKLKVARLPSSHERDVAKWEVDCAEKKIMEWQRHILRGVQQSKARLKSFKELGPASALWIRDFAQKYNPTKTLEAMNEYFGKRGMTVSVEVFITKLFNSYHKQVYLVSLDRSDQDTLETLCIADTVLDQFSKDNPHIKRIDIKTDNAGNYHANGVPEFMYKLAQKRGIIIGSYDYNEAQLGKDQCDREAAFLKKCAERWLLQVETNRITNAKELTNAVFWNGGPKNTKMCVLKIDKSMAAWDGYRKITNISYYHSVEFHETGAFYREYFDIGEGKFYEYNDITFVNGASIFVDWISSKRQNESMTYDSRNKQQNIPCPEPLCVLEFTNENDMMSHVEADCHQYAKIKNGMDNAIFYYAQQKDIQNVSNKGYTPEYVEHRADSSKSLDKIYFRGWARKVRTVRRLTLKQKDFITKLFQQGDAAQSKLSAEQMADRMKYETDRGEYYFRPDEYLETTQIRSLISRLKKQQNKHTHDLLTMTEDDGIEENLDEICDMGLSSDDEDFEGFDGL